MFFQFKGYQKSNQLILFNKIKTIFICTLALFALFHVDVSAQFVSSNLPIIIIDTEGSTIQDEPKTNVKFQIIYDENGSINDKNSINYYYDGFAGVEYRGSFSQNFPKKNISLELRSDTTNNDEDNVELFGIAKESDWVSVANYNERSHLKNTLSYEFFRRSGAWAPHTMYCELIINNEYQGLYTFTERIKRDKNRVDIKKLDEDDDSPYDITGGYLIVNNDNDQADDGWSSYNGPQKKTFEISHPKNPTSIQKDYIENYFGDFEDALNSSNFRDTLTGFRKYIDIESFTRSIIFQELSKSSDAYYRSQYFFKDRNGKLNAGPIWDFDFAYGRRFFGYDNPRDWRLISPGNPPLFWYEKFNKDCEFMDHIRNVYAQYRSSILTPQDVFAYIDSVNTLLSASAARDNAKWHSAKSDDFDDVVQDLKTWIGQRIEWMDDNIHNLTENSPVLTSSLSVQNRNEIVDFSVNACMSSSTITWELSNEYEKSTLPFTSRDISIPISVESYITAYCRTKSEGCYAPSNAVRINVTDPCNSIITLSSDLVKPPTYQIHHAGNHLNFSTKVSDMRLELKAGNTIQLLPGSVLSAENSFVELKIEDCPE
jgi:hypothetical protein